MTRLIAGLCILVLAGSLAHAQTVSKSELVALFTPAEQSAIAALVAPARRTAPSKKAERAVFCKADEFACNVKVWLDSIPERIDLRSPIVRSRLQMMVGAGIISPDRAKRILSGERP